MVSVGLIGGSSGDGRSAGYYTSSVAKGRDDYYTGKGEADGEWFGAGARALGLEGTIDAEAFHRVVMEAVDPGSGELVEEWWAIAGEFGLDQAEIDALTEQCDARPVVAGAELQALNGRLASSEGLTEKAATFDRRDVVQAMAAAHPYGASVGHVEGLAENFLGSHHVLAVEGEAPIAGLERRAGATVRCWCARRGRSTRRRRCWASKRARGLGPQAGRGIPLPSMQMAKDGYITVNAVAFSAKVQERPPDWEPLMRDLMQKPENAGFVWRRLQYVFGLSDPR